MKYKYHSLYELDSLAVVNIRDDGSLVNAFKILMFPDIRIFAVSSPKAKVMMMIMPFWLVGTFFNIVLFMLPT